MNSPKKSKCELVLMEEKRLRNNEKSKKAYHKKVLTTEEREELNKNRREAYKRRKEKAALEEDYAEKREERNRKMRERYKMKKEMEGLEGELLINRAERNKKSRDDYKQRKEKEALEEDIAKKREEINKKRREQYKQKKEMQTKQDTLTKFQKKAFKKKHRASEQQSQETAVKVQLVRAGGIRIMDQRLDDAHDAEGIENPQLQSFHHDEIQDAPVLLIEDEYFVRSHDGQTLELKPIGYFIPKLLKKFEEAIKEGPTYICSCCGRLFFKKGISGVTDEMIKSWGLNEEKRKLILFVNQEHHLLCHSCKDSAKKKKIPRMSLSNGLNFPVIPQELQYLTQLEQRLVAGRIPFMQIQLVGFQKQWLLRGNVVNVPNNLDKAINFLPRNFEDTAMIQLKLMRRMMYKNPYLYAKIRPAKVIAAAEYLVHTPLYQAEGITLSTDWGDKYYGEEVDFEVTKGDDENNSNQIEIENGNEPMEEYVEGEGGQVDDVQTLFFRPDLTPEGLKIAPGEGNIPIPYYKDPNAGLLSFPSIYCGELIDYKVKLHLTEIVRSELMRYDRRCAVPEKILFDFKRMFNTRIKDAYYICLRQKAAHHNGKPLTAGNVRSDEGIRNILAKDDGYSCYKEVRSTPAYWQEECKKLMAMVRQRGCCTFFITLSAAESRWEDLLRILLSLQIKQQQSICDFLGMTQEEIDRCLEDDILLLPHVARAKLISSDPVTCMRYFDFKYRELVNTLIKPKKGVFDPYKLDDYYFRIEYQMRGSAHLHGMLWQGDAPRFDRNVEGSREDCIRFIDQHVSCSLAVDEELKRLVNSLQVHRHSQTCKKTRRKVRVCRFNYPKPPLKSTMILDALPTETEDAEKKRLTQIYTCVEDFLNNKLGPKYNGNMTIDEMLGELEVSYEDYVKAIQTTFGKRTTVFLRRSTSECFVNAYNPHVLRAWKANMDLQFVLDGYACGKYVGSYISKAGGGVSKLLRAASADVKDGNRSMKNKLEQFGDILIRGTEISAQEGSAFAIGMPMVNCSRSVVFAATGEIGSRIRMLKSKAELAKLEENSQEIYVRGPAYYYAHRPDEMENVCYAEFLTKWTTPRQEKKEKEKVVNEDDEEPVEEVEEISHHDEQGPRCQYKEREKHKILRFCNFSKTKDCANYWREQLLLFVPWRNEDDEIQAPGNFHERAKEQEDVIIQNSRPFYYSRKDITALDDPHADLYFEEVFENNSDKDSDEEDEDKQSREVDFNLDEEEEITYTNETLTGRKGKELQRFTPPRICDNTEYLQIMRDLNELQRQFVLEVLYRLKTNADPFYFYLAGGAGVGKSRVVTAVVQSFLRYCHNSSDDRYPVQSLPTIIGAPTGKAAFNVMGNTIHSLFRLPPNQQNREIGPLEESIAQSLRVRFAHTKLFIIDEISMVGAIQLYIIDHRLRQIFQTNQDFGGRSILAVGDFRQLPPIGMRAVYKCPKLSNNETEREAMVSVNDLWKKFQFFELTEIMRQRNEHLFCKALNNCATGTMDDEDIALMNARIVSKDEAPKDAIWLFWSNLECEDFNKDYHDSLQSEAVFIKAEHVISKEDGTDFERLTAILAAEQLKRNETNGLLNSVNLQIGAVYFVTINIDVGDGLFNGATGDLKAIERDSRTNKVVAAWLQFCHPSIGQEVRKDPSVIRRQERNKYPRTWTPIGFQKVRLQKSKKLGNFEITRIMIPLQAANGMTICKSQGSSLPKVVVNLKDGMTRQQVYVACSRATSYDNFFIVGKFRAPALADDDDSYEIERLRRNPLQFQLRFPSDFQQPSSVYYHNVGGFFKNLPDIKCDRNVFLHDYLIFAEPKLRKEAQVILPGYRVHYRIDCSNEDSNLNSEGILLFVKACAANPLNVNVFTDKDVSHGAVALKSNCTILVVELEKCFLVAAYKSPKYCIQRFMENLKRILSPLWNQKSILLFGDMNINLQTHSSLFNWLTCQGLNFVISTQSSTTNSNSNIDVCLSNHPNCEATVYEIYYTYHKALSIHF